MAIEDLLSDITKRFASAGAAALTPSELIVNNISDAAFFVTSGGVSGLLYNTTETRKREISASVSAVPMPEFSEWLAKAFACKDKGQERLLEREFAQFEESVYSRLEDFLSSSAASRPT